MNKRSCGECTLCCTIMGVVELKKPVHTNCEHQSCFGCKIYEDRPSSCKEFKCLWLEEGEHLPGKHSLRKRLFWENERPDKNGVMFHGTQPNIELTTPVLVARGDFDKGKDTLTRFAGRFLIVLAYEDGRRKLMGPEPAIREAQQNGIRVEERNTP